MRSRIIGLAVAFRMAAASGKFYRTGLWGRTVCREGADAPEFHPMATTLYRPSGRPYTVFAGSGGLAERRGASP